jgi:outer membrane immunogenic protein
MPVKAPPVRAPIAYSWNGCYGGVNAGAAWTRIRHNLSVPGEADFSTSDRDTSFTGGGQLGCNWQIDPSWVVGVEGDFNYLKASHNTGFAFSGEDTVGNQETKLRWLGTLRARLGYSWNRVLLYGTGGLAFGDVKSSVNAITNDGDIFSGSYSKVRFGWAAGAGIEYAFADRWSAKFEYLHFDLGSFNYLVTQAPGGTNNLPPVWNASGKVNGDILRVGLNYRFWP